MACMQLAPRVGDREWNRNHAKSAIRQMGAVETQIILLPELASSGYVFESVEEARACGEAAHGPSVSVLAVGADDTGVVIVGGFAELGDDGRLYNSAAIVGPDGVLAVYRKTHLWDREKLRSMPGAQAPP